MIDIFAVNLTHQIEQRDFNNLLSLLSKEKREKILRFRNYEDAQRGLIGDILVRKIVCNRTGLRNEDIEFINNKFGKPFLKNTNKIKFNISHSGKWVVCAISEKDIGIDIERIQPIDINFVKRIFTIKENEEIMRINKELQLKYFYELWTCKESYIKALGEGLSIALNSFSIQIKENCISIRTDRDLNNFFPRMYNIDKNYKMAVCSTENSSPDEVNMISLEDLIEEMRQFNSIQDSKWIGLLRRT